MIITISRNVTGNAVETKSSNARANIHGHIDAAIEIPFYCGLDENEATINVSTPTHYLDMMMNKADAEKLGKALLRVADCIMPEDEYHDYVVGRS